MAKQQSEAAPKKPAASEELTDEELNKVSGGAIDAFLDFTKQTGGTTVQGENKP
jgi:bacteriocin-like protein